MEREPELSARLQSVEDTNNPLDVSVGKHPASVGKRKAECQGGLATPVQEQLFNNPPRLRVVSNEEPPVTDSKAE